MTGEEMTKVVERMEKWAVPQERILKEIMRSRYLDYHLFSNPANRLYGLSQEDLYKAMRKTEHLFGAYEGGVTEYAHMYSFALYLDPFSFMEDVESLTEEEKILFQTVLERAQSEGTTILLVGIDAYLSGLSTVYTELADKRIAVVVQNQKHKEELQYIFPQWRIMLPEDLNDDGESYDYIFSVINDDGQTTEKAKSHLKPTGKMDVLSSYTTIVNAERGVRTLEKGIAASHELQAYRYTVINGEEAVWLEIGKQSVDMVRIGQIYMGEETGLFSDIFSINSSEFAEADEWSYDVYAYNASIPLQTILASGLLSVDYTVSEAYFLVEKEKLETGKPLYRLPLPAGVEDFGLRKDLAEETRMQGKSGAMLSTGDLVITLDDQKLRMAVVSDEEEGLVIDEEGVVLRPREGYTGEYLKLYFESPVGQLFLKTLENGGKYDLVGTRLLRFPLPRNTEDTIMEATNICRAVTGRLKVAETEWREAKRDAVSLLMGKGAKK